jgi:hypothetical protein
MNAAGAIGTEVLGPVETKAEAYQLQITGDQIDLERELIAKRLLDVESFGRSIAGLRKEFQRRELTRAYIEVEPFIERMLTVELDVKSPKGPGIGEALVGAPEPRFGAKFRRALSKEGAREALGNSLERLVLTGYMAALVAGAYDNPGMQYYSAETTKISTEKYLQWKKWFPAVCDQLTLRVNGLDGGPLIDVSAQMYLVTTTVAVMLFEADCMKFKVKGPLGLTKGNRDHFRYYGFSAGWVLGQLSANSAIADEVLSNR